MVLDKREQALVSQLGVYGIWLLKHGKLLPKDNEKVQKLMQWYGRYQLRPEHCAAALVMTSIDTVVQELEWEPVLESHEEALYDLKFARAGESNERF